MLVISIEIIFLNEIIIPQKKQTLQLTKKKVNEISENVYPVDDTDREK